MTPYSLVAKNQRLCLYFINLLFNESVKCWRYVQQLVEWELVGETEVFGGGEPPYCCFARNKSYI
jgi:hypothetical protein